MDVPFGAGIRQGARLLHYEGRWMLIGTIAVIFALAAAGWVLVRASRGGGGESRTMFRLKLVGLLAVATVLFAAKLFPLALMILISAGGVSAIEVWRSRAIKGLDQAAPGAGMAPAPRSSLNLEEAAAILGVAIDAHEEEIRAAHKKLIGQLHPDKGGTDYLAAKINDARQKMLESAAARQTTEV